MFGTADRIRSDNGPQFRKPFSRWCSDNGIVHETSSPENPQSNGHAERGVRIAKSLLKKSANMSDYRKNMAIYRNSPTGDGGSPSEKESQERNNGVVDIDKKKAPSKQSNERNTRVVENDKKKGKTIKKNLIHKRNSFKNLKSFFWKYTYVVNNQSYLYLIIFLSLIFFNFIF